MCLAVRGSQLYFRRVYDIVLPYLEILVMAALVARLRVAIDREMIEKLRVKPGPMTKVAYLAGKEKKVRKK